MNKHKPIIETATLCLRYGILGWRLVASHKHPQNDIDSWLSDLYGGDWRKRKASELAFLRGETIDKAIAHIKEICPEVGMTVSFCGGGHTVRLWRERPAAEPEVFQVDLKWSAWTEDEGIWNEYAPGIWEKMLNAFTGATGPVTIQTSPRKEVRHGSVTIQKGAAFGHFCEHWDECSTLADLLGTECDDAFCEMIPHSQYLMEPGIDWEFSNVKARKFPVLMRKISDEETNLLVEDKNEWTAISSLYRRAP